MPVFNWKARTRQGAVKKGVMEAQNDEAVMAILRAQNLLPVTVKAAPKDLMEFLPDIGSPVSTRELVVFTRQFSTMIDAGLPLVQCLEILADQEPNKKFKDILLQVKSGNTNLLGRAVLKINFNITAANNRLVKLRNLVPLW